MRLTYSCGTVGVVCNGVVVFARVLCRVSVKVGGITAALWSRYGHAIAHVDRPGSRGLNLCSCPGSVDWTPPHPTPQAGRQATDKSPWNCLWVSLMSPPPLFLFSISPFRSILSTASCEAQRRRSVQDLPGICTESSQVRCSAVEQGLGCRV